MKEAYFTSSNIKFKGEDFLNKVKKLREKKKYHFQLDKSALLVLDMQKFFLSESSHAFVPSAPALISNIQDLIEVFVKNYRPIVTTRHVNTIEDANQMNKWWKDLIKEDSDASLIIKEITDIISTYEFVFSINKTQYDAFYKTTLEESLRKWNVSQVVVCGVKTHLCCETTTRSAFIRGFEVFFTIDGTATLNEEFHTASIMNLAHGFAIPVLTRELITQVDE
ncbi:MAG: isochorismatase family protein [Candidatus Hodarchaeales archaeon]|jgi:isochorismate hydrolase